RRLARLRSRGRRRPPPAAREVGRRMGEQRGRQPGEIVPAGHLDAVVLNIGGSLRGLLAGGEREQAGQRGPRRCPARSRWHGIVRWLRSAAPSAAPEERVTTVMTPR